MSEAKKERKAFNFFKSYFDVFQALENDSDKLAFISALLNRQFYGIEPTNLKGMSNFAYISQKYNIDSQVNGYQDKTGVTLTPTEGGYYTPTEQEEGKGEEEEKEEEKVYSDEIKNFTTKISKFFPSELILKLSKKDGLNWIDTIDKLIRIDNYSYQQIEDAVSFARTNDFWKGNFLSVLKLRKKKDGISYIDLFLNKLEASKSTQNNKSTSISHGSDFD